MKTNPTTDLLARYARERDPETFGELFEATAPRLFSLALQLARDPADADDLLQATYVAAIETVERFDPTQSTARDPGLAWLMGILANKSRMERRSRAKLAGAKDVNELADLASAEPQADSPLAAGENKKLLERAISNLPDLYRPVLELVARHGLGPAEVAARLERSPGAVRVQLHRGIALLRNALPAGVALPTALAALESTGFESVRAALLERAARPAVAAVDTGPGLASGSTPLAATLAVGSSNGIKLAAAAIGLTLVATSAAVLLNGLADPGAGGVAAIEAPRKTPVSRPFSPLGLETPAAQPVSATPGEGQIAANERTAAVSEPSEEPPAAGGLVAHHEFTLLDEAEAWSFVSGSVVPAGEGDFEIRRGDFTAGAGAQLAALPEGSLPEAFLARGVCPPSGDALLRGVLGFDPDALAWGSSARYDSRNGESSTFLIRTASGWGVVALVNER